MLLHGNSPKSTRPQHLYEIWDKADGGLFKYGISSGPFGKDGLSRRIRQQLSLMNTVVGWARFFANILRRNIAGRAEAERIEDEMVDAFEREHGRRPAGNPTRKKRR